mmetsp:Transcript_38822/g.102654  ORF Transcript_38822/g.102654 Transcript_38822/m.102654 type:complete len:206 (-) Transcript_38822:122-739(-)
MGHDFPATFAPIFGLLISWTIVCVAYSPAIHSGSAALHSGELSLSARPHLCSAGSCWDQASHFSEPCTPGDETGGFIRGRVMNPDQASCYQTIYYNLDQGSMLCLGILMIWTVLGSKTFGYLLILGWKRNIRFTVLITVVLMVHSWFYGFNMIFIYVNESMASMLRSQLYFSITETVSVILVRVRVHEASIELECRSIYRVSIEL